MLKHRKLQLTDVPVFNHQCFIKWGKTENEVDLREIEIKTDIDKKPKLSR